MKQAFKPIAWTTLIAAALAGGTTPIATAADKSAAAMSSQSARAQQAVHMRASRLIGEDVRNAQGERLGEIKDLILDLNNARVHYAILEFGGFLGLGEKWFAYPLRLFNASADRDELVLNVAKERLQNAPGFKRNNWPDWTGYRRDVDRYFGDTGDSKPMPNQQLRRASELVGSDVEDPTGKNVGEINDIVVNMGSGSVEYVVLDFDPSWMARDKLLPLPLSAFGFSGERGESVLKVPKERLDMARGFDKDNWPDLNDRGRQAEMQRYLRSIQTSPGATSSATERPSAGVNR